MLGTGRHVMPRRVKLMECVLLFASNLASSILIILIIIIQLVVIKSV